MCVSVDGMLGCKATAFLKWISVILLANWEMDYLTVIGWVRAMFLFAILCATLLLGFCTKWFALGLIDGAYNKLLIPLLNTKHLDSLPP